MEAMVGGSLGKLYFAHLEPKEDLYHAIASVVKQNNIETGVVLNITGALSVTRLSAPTKVDDVASPPGLIHEHGTAEVSGSGYFGMTEESWSSSESGIDYRAGEPFIHVHLTASVGGQVYSGHLLEGCLVRSLHPSSHFVVVIAEATGMALTYHSGRESMPGYPNGVPYYHLDTA